MDIIIKDVSQLTPTEYNACYKANYGIDGYMQEELRNCRLAPISYPGKVILLWDGPVDKVSSLLGWALLTPTRTRGLLATTEYIKRVSKYSVQLWVKAPYRGRGYSKVLMDEVMKLDPRPNVFPHDKRSGALYSQYRVSCAGWSRKYWLKKPRAV